MAVVIAPIEIVTPPKRYDSVGRCIYCFCGTKKLTNEHIIAHGLAGDSLVLPKSSCIECAEKTRDWETACLRHLWWPFRTRIGAPTSGKQDPKSFTIRQMHVAALHEDRSIASYERRGEISVDPMEFPLMFITYKFPPPGVLVGRPSHEVVNYEVAACVNREEFKKFSPGDKDGMYIAPLNPNAYARMLAKIAHAYAVAELGESAFKPVLRRFIRGKQKGPSSYWVGGELNLPAAEPHLHDIRWRVTPSNVGVLVIVELRLFAFFGGPRYHVVVGTLTRPLNQLPFTEQPLYTIDMKTAVPVGEFVPFDQGLTGTWT